MPRVRVSRAGILSNTPEDIGPPVVRYTATPGIERGADAGPGRGVAPAAGPYHTFQGAWLDLQRSSRKFFSFSVSMQDQNP